MNGLECFVVALLGREARYGESTCLSNATHAQLNDLEGSMDVAQFTEADDPESVMVRLAHRVS